MFSVLIPISGITDIIKSNIHFLSQATQVSQILLVNIGTNTIRMEREYSKVKLINTLDKGVYEALSEGIDKHAIADNILVLDGNIQVGKRFAQKLSTHYINNHLYAIKVNDVFSNNQVMLDARQGNKIKAEMFYICAVAFSKTDAYNVGYFNNGDIVDFAVSMRDSGVKLKFLNQVSCHRYVSASNFVNIEETDRNIPSPPPITPTSTPKKLVKPKRAIPNTMSSKNIIPNTMPPKNIITPEGFEQYKHDIKGLDNSEVYLICIGIHPSFCEFNEAIAQSLIDMGYGNIKIFYYHHADLKSGKVKMKFSNDINIISSPQITHEEFILPSNNSIKILIWTEQSKIPLTYDKWDLILTFFADLANHEKEVHFQLGYSKAFDNPTLGKVQSHNLFCFGANMPYRLSVCKKFGIHFERFVWGSHRDSLIQNAKLNININAFNRPYYFAKLHALLVLCRGKILLQQQPAGIYDAYRPFITVWNDSNFGSLSKYWLEDDARRIGHEKNVKDLLMKTLDFTYNFKECVKNVL